MVALLELLKQKKKELYPRNQRKEKNNIFSKVEEVNNRKIYHTKIFNDFYTFGISKNEPTKFFISLRGIFNIEDISMFHLFSLRGDDIFLGIYYGIKKLDKAFLVRNFNKRETYTLRKCEYIEFRFKKGGVFCYLSGLHNLLKKIRLKVLIIKLY
ncbi:Putative cytosolic protein (plasmid) [Borrelia miyamotoi FR64b]|nr:Putative cytosolic protein [Borrelia miyamotoi FR64b]